MEGILDNHINESTHYDGPRCPFYPSCAAYAKKALKTNSYLSLFLVIDRFLIRDIGANIDVYYLKAPTKLSKSPRLLDPLEDNFLFTLKNKKRTLFNFDYID
ncbi:MAG: membrane protein insertion efficiency factor YidD [Leptospiraceae bacterium]|nr:membrane protein insertion efficiency factor YidD [Leptospiraceae bacterium]